MHRHTHTHTQTLFLLFFVERFAFLPFFYWLQFSIIVCYFFALNGEWIFTLLCIHKPQFFLLFYYERKETLLLVVDPRVRTTKVSWNVISCNYIIDDGKILSRNFSRAKVNILQYISFACSTLFQRSLSPRRTRNRANNTDSFFIVCDFKVIQILACATVSECYPDQTNSKNQNGTNHIYAMHLRYVFCSMFFAHTKARCRIASHRITLFCRCFGFYWHGLILESTGTLNRFKCKSHVFQTRSVHVLFTVSKQISNAMLYIHAYSSYHSEWHVKCSEFISMCCHTEI